MGGKFPVDIPPISNYIPGISDQFPLSSFAVVDMLWTQLRVILVLHKHCRDDIMVHPNRVVSHTLNVKQEHEEIPSSAQLIGGRRTASLKTKGRMIQLTLKIIYNETQNKDDVVVLNKQYPPRSDKNGSFRGHDEEFSSLAGKPLELYDEDGDKLDGASFSGVTKGSFLKFEDNMYAVEVVDPTPFEKETATSQQDLATGKLYKIFIPCMYFQILIFMFC
jgi:hypothetical protein